MRNEPLLTSDELAFLQQLLDEPAPSAPAPSAPARPSGLTLDSSPDVQALLASLDDGATLSVEVQVNGQRLSFPVRLSQQGLQNLQMRLESPQIFEKGIVERPWRATLPTPWPLIDRQGKPSGLTVRQLSANGALLAAEAGQQLPDHFMLWLQLPDMSTISLRGRWVRQVKDGLAAYRITPQQRNGLARLQEVLVRLHNEAQQD